MELTVDLFKPRIEVNVRHGNEVLSFPANVFAKKPFERGFDPFYEINEYWRRKPPAFQFQVFSLYKEVYDAFDCIMNPDELYTELNRLIIALYQLHKLEDLELWLRLCPTVVIPETVKENLPDPTDNTKTMGKTYIVSDYYPLLSLSMFLRLLVPIWGEYISSIRRNTEVDKKEFIAMQLLNGTGLMESQAMLRLRVYIDELTNSAENVDWERVLDGFSSEDIGFLMVSLVCVRQLCLADLRGTDPHTQSIAMIWKFLMYRVFDNTESNIKIKKNSDSENASPEQHSVIESYRRREELSVGDIAEFQYFISQGYDLACFLQPDITLAEYEASLETALEIETENVGDPQLIIAGWLIKHHITPHAPWYVKDGHIPMLAALEAVLWKRGFKHLAAIVTSYAIVNVEELAVGYINTREQLPGDVLSGIRKHYPFEWGGSKKKGAVNRHPVVESIDTVADQLFFNSWRMTLAKDKVESLFGEKRRKLIIPSDIKSMLGRLIIDNEERILHVRQQ